MYVNAAALDVAATTVFMVWLLPRNKLGTPWSEARSKPHVRAIKPHVRAIKPRVRAIKPRVRAIKPRVRAIKQCCTIVLTDILFEGSETSPACPSDESIIKTKMSMKDW
jgi:hypothetical protein